jgi:NTP pyrophosphatase (non-canonical NTP hydrolase)
MNEMQKRVHEHLSQYEVPYWTPHQILARLAEETGELAREINHRWGPKPKKQTEAVRELEEEVGDILFTLICFANSQGLELDRCFDRAMDKATGRDADRFEKK